MRRSTRRRATVRCIVLGTLAVAAVSARGDVSFYKTLPQSRMTQDDTAMAAATLKRALDTGEAGRSYAWQNPATGASGFVRPRTPPFAQGELTCRRAVIATSAGGLSNESSWTLCRVGDDWKFTGD